MLLPTLQERFIVKLRGDREQSRNIGFAVASTSTFKRRWQVGNGLIFEPRMVVNEIHVCSFAWSGG